MTPERTVNKNLALVQRIVHRAGGRITVTSTEGARFEVWLRQRSAHTDRSVLVSAEQRAR